MPKNWQGQFKGSKATATDFKQFFVIDPIFKFMVFLYSLSGLSLAVVPLGQALQTVCLP